MNNQSDLITDTLLHFCQGQLNLDQLETFFQQILIQSPEKHEEIRHVLRISLEQKQLSPEHYLSLLSSLDRISHSENRTDDDETRFSPVTQSLTDDETRVSSLNAESSALSSEEEATVVINPAGRTAPAKTVSSGFQAGSTAATLSFTQTTSTSAGLSNNGPLGIGSTLKERFVLQDVLGSGGMGVVYKALDLRKQEARDKSPYVALKILNEDIKNNATAYIALQRETQKAQTLAHPNIITVYDFDRDKSHVFMSMEILDGQSLGRYISEKAPNGLPFKKAWYIIKGLCLALAYAHKHGIVHSDFKPGNVCVLENGEVKVLDFGIACAVSRHDAEQDQTVFDARRDLGALTPAYASLEMFYENDPDPSDDVYALACVTYEILTGKHPYGKLSAPKAMELNLQPKMVSGLSRRQWKTLAKGLAFKRQDRIQSVQQFMNGLQAKSALPIILGSLAVLTLIAGIAGYIQLAQEIDPLQDKIIQLSPEQQLKIKDLLDLAEIHFDVGYLTAPTGSNALWSYRQVLEIDPYNKEAKQGLKKIADILSEQAEQLYVKGKHDESLTKIEEGLEAIPKHQALLDLKAKILRQP
ncbi:MAG: serine/threonine-protein kinase [Methylicorpusculum sp.]|nr:serine/threonine-protein kinase [Methylicorpusculum sp.]